MSFASIDLVGKNRSDLGLFRTKSCAPEKGVEIDIERARDQLESLTVDNGHIHSSGDEHRGHEGGSSVTLGLEKGSKLAALQENLVENKSKHTLIGQKPYRTCISVSDFSVKVAQTSSCWDQCRNYFSLGRTSTMKKASEYAILRKINAIVQPGEMLLILGRPGSGCTTLLRSMAASLDPTYYTEGELCYNGIKATQALDIRSIYCHPEDIHIPSLTVSQTLDFALSARLSSISAHERKKVLSKLLDIFNLSDQANTIVGDESIRGLSGGERKRLSIVEVLASQPAVACWDNSTLGLDAGVALQFVHALKILTEVYESITCAALYQVSDKMFSLFDKVLILENGEQQYFGPVLQARPYFQAMGFNTIPSQPVAEFLVDCVNTGHVKNGIRRHHPRELSDCFVKSAHYTGLIAERELVLRRATASRVQTRRARTLPPFFHQLYLTAKRHATMRIQNRQALLTKAVTAILVAVIIGTVYWNLPRTQAGTFTRGGVIFITLLYNAFTAFVELPAVIAIRPLLEKQRAMQFYRPSALSIGQVLVDFLFAASEILLFTLVMYFMTNLQKSATHFIVFYVCILLGQTIMTFLFRLLGSISRTIDQALRFASVIITMMILTSGYMIPRNSIRWTLRWFSWVNPLAFDFSAMMSNEFEDLTITCTGAGLIPNGVSYTDIDLQVCTVPGTSPGNPQVPGYLYLESAFGFGRGSLPKNLAILMAFFGILFVVSTITIETVRISTGSTHRPRTQLPGVFDSLVPVSGDYRDEAVSGGNLYTWQNVSYTVTTGKTKKQLLFGIDGVAAPGKLVALMGPSGAGKSTLLDVLACRKTTGKVEGTFKINGSPLHSSFASTIGYCEQMDIHDPSQTVQEAIAFSAALRQAETVSLEDKSRCVSDILSMLDLSHLADTEIGHYGQGISVEDRKRVTIAVELAKAPCSTLFLDEPTSGLDSQSALSLVRLLHSISRKGTSIVCTIHQPSATIFNLFDNLVLLDRGQTVFSGPISDFRPYLTSHGLKADPECNLAELALQTLTNEGGSASNMWGAKWSKDTLKTNLLDNIEQLNTSGSSNRELEICSEGPVTSFSHQCRWVCSRALLDSWRMPGYASTRLFVHIAVALIAGLTFLRLGDSVSDLQYRIFVIFQVTVLPSMILSQVQIRYNLDRSVSHREISSNMYSPAIFVLSQVISEIPISVVCSIAFYLLLYFMSGFSKNADRAVYQYFMILMTEFLSVSLGQAIASLTPSSYVASLFTPFLLITLSVFCGVTIPPSQIPSFYQWLYRLNPFTYLVGGMIETELSSLPVECKPWEFHIFHPRTGQTCAEYANAFLQGSTATGYLSNGNATSDCAYCPYRDGSSMLDQFGLDWNLRGMHLGITAVFVVSTLVILFIAGTRLRFVKR